MQDDSQTPGERATWEARQQLWNELIKTEPRLQELLLEAQRVSNDTPAYNELQTWYLSFKPRLEKLVGFHAEKKELKSSKAYDAAYRIVLDALPEARDWSEEEIAEWREREGDNG